MNPSCMTTTSGETVIKTVEFDGVNIDAWDRRFKHFLGSYDFTTYEYITSTAGDRANLPNQASALRTWQEKNRKGISLICLAVPDWCGQIVTENVGDPPNVKEGYSMRR